MKLNFENSQNSFRNNQKADAKSYADIGKAYQILVKLSNDYFKNAKKLNNIQSKYNSEQELREIINNKISNFKQGELEEAELGNDREYANYFAGKMKECYSDAEKAWNRNDKASAKKFSEQGDAYKEYMQNYNKKAAQSAFVKNNATKDSTSELDLHGLTVFEASPILDEKVKSCLSQGIGNLNIITGKGLHSGDKGPKLKNLVTEYASKKGISSFVDPYNDGCIVFYF
jgi:DNA-nicking Smr family endonuclease